jgi:hypothetical protein
MSSLQSDTAARRRLDGAQQPAFRGSGDTCPYHKSNSYVLMVQPTEDGPRFDVPGALNDPSNRRILA